jgi:hypothetical protein
MRVLIKTIEIHYFSNVFWYRTLHVSDRLTVHHQESSTAYTAIGICRPRYVDGARGGVVVKALRYKSAGLGINSRWCHWNFSVT